MSDSGMVEKSSLPSERERFERVFRRTVPPDAFRMVRASPVTPEMVYASSAIEQAWIGWQAASAGRQELLEALMEIAGDDIQRLAEPLHKKVRALIATHGG